VGKSRPNILTQKDGGEISSNLKLDAALKERGLNSLAPFPPADAQEFIDELVKLREESVRSGPEVRPDEKAGEDRSQ